MLDFYLSLYCFFSTFENSFHLSIPNIKHPGADGVDTSGYKPQWFLLY